MRTLLEPSRSQNHKLCVALHDVSPATWPACEQLLQALEQVQTVPITFLVVPHFYQGTAACEDRDFEALLTERVAKGDELVLHGWHHLDDQPVTNVREHLRRRWYTAGEGEFAALSATMAQERLEQGIQWFDRNGWPLHGFVAPAWLMSKGTIQVLCHMSFRYTTTLNHFVLLPDLEFFKAPALVYSVRSQWRRIVSKHWLRKLADTTAHQPVIRFGLHPADAAFPEVIRDWQQLLEQMLETRSAITKIEVVDELQRTQKSSTTLSTMHHA